MTFTSGTSVAFSKQIVSEYRWYVQLLCLRVLSLLVEQVVEIAGPFYLQNASLKSPCNEPLFLVQYNICGMGLILKIVYFRMDCRKFQVIFHFSSVSFLDITINSLINFALTK